MKKLIILVTTIFFSPFLFAQSETSVDTIKVGNYIILKKRGGEDTDTTMPKKEKKNINIDISIGYSSKKKAKSNVSTNWFIFDLGFTNMRDQTNYTTAQSGSYFQILKPANGPVTENSTNLINNKSSNFNMWFFMQKINISKHQLNLKYGLGLEGYNFRYERSLSYRKDPMNFVFNDSINFSKNKLYAGYLTVPFMINFTATPDKKKGFSISAGLSAGYLISSRNKQISNERGKQKIIGNFDLEPFRLAAIGEIGLGPVRLYGSYSLNTLHKSNTGFQQYPYALGIRFSNW